MPIYEYNGVHYDIDTADPAIAKKKILDNLPPPKGATDYAKDFGKSAASLADTGINMATGMWDYGAYNLARAAGRSPEQATQETASPKDYLGRAFGITQDPAYQQEASRQAMNAVGGAVQDYAVKPIASATGLPEQDVSSMVNSVGLAAGPVAARGVGAVGSGLKTAGTAVADATGGALGRATGYIAKPGETPTGFQVPSSRIPLTGEYTTPQDWNAFQQGQLPYGQFPKTTPIQELPQNWLQRQALKLSGGEIPAAGQAAKAFGERIGETYRNPITAAIDVGSMFATGGIPVLTAARGGLAALQGGADYILGKKGFDPGLPAKMAEYKSGAIPMPGAPPVQTPTAGPVAPRPVPQLGYTPTQQPPMYVSPEGVAGSNMNQVSQAGAQQKYAPQPVPQTPAQVAQQAAASKIISPVAPTPQSIPQIAASKIEGAPPVQAAPMQAPQIQNANNIVAQQQAFAKSQLPPARAPIQAPVAQPSNIINSKLTKLDEEMTALRENNMAEGVKPNTPAGDAYSKQMNEMSKQAQALQKELDLAKKAEKAQKKTPGNVSQMIVPDSSGTFNALKLPDNASAMERKIAMAPQASRDIIEQNLRKQLASADTKSKALLEETLKLFDKYRFK